MRKLLLLSFAFIGAQLPAQTPGYSPNYAEEMKPLADILDQRVEAWRESQEVRPSAQELAKLNTYGFAPGEVPTYDAATVEKRLKALNFLMPMDYNPVVREFMNFYTLRYRERTELLLGRAEVFFPMFERILESEGMPIELKYLPVIESAINPKARSWAGAVGLWQFMHATGRMYGLKVDSYVDERMDPEKATRAAARYLRDLHGIYNDWLMAIAAYNCGPGRLNMAVRYAQEKSPGPKTYWEVAPYLPAETRGYVPGFIGAVYALNYATEHNLYPTRLTLNFDADSIKVVRQKLDLRELARKTGADPQTLLDLNPELKLGVVPYSEKPYRVRVPAEVAMAVRNGAKAGTLELGTQQPLKAQATSLAEPAGKLVYHTVKEGESVQSIAAQYGVTADNILKWNNMWAYKVVKGYSLKLYVPLDKAQQVAALAPAPATPPANAPKPAASTPKPAASSPKPAASTPKPAAGASYHSVRSGDTLGAIARTHGTTVSKLCSLNGISANSTLRIGQRIRVR